MCDELAALLTNPEQRAPHRGFLSFGICLIWRPGSRILKQSEGEIRNWELRIDSGCGIPKIAWDDGIERKFGWGRWDWKNPLGTLWTTFCKISSLRKRRHLTTPPLASSVRGETSAVFTLFHYVSASGCKRLEKTSNLI